MLPAMQLVGDAHRIRPLDVYRHLASREIARHIRPPAHTLQVHIEIIAREVARTIRPRQITMRGRDPRQLPPRLLACTQRRDLVRRQGKRKLHRRRRLALQQPGVIQQDARAQNPKTPCRRLTVYIRIMVDNRADSPLSSGSEGNSLTNDKFALLSKLNAMKFAIDEYKNQKTRDDKTLEAKPIEIKKETQIEVRREETRKAE